MSPSSSPAWAEPMAWESEPPSSAGELQWATWSSSPHADSPTSPSLPMPMCPAIPVHWTLTPAAESPPPCAPLETLVLVLAAVRVLAERLADAVHAGALVLAVAVVAAVVVRRAPLVAVSVALSTSDEEVLGAAVRVAVESVRPVATSETPELLVGVPVLVLTLVLVPALTQALAHALLLGACFVLDPLEPGAQAIEEALHVAVQLGQGRGRGSRKEPPMRSSDWRLRLQSCLLPSPAVASPPRHGRTIACRAVRGTNGDLQGRGGSLTRAAPTPQQVWAEMAASISAQGPPSWGDLEPKWLREEGGRERERERERDREGNRDRDRNRER